MKASTMFVGVAVAGLFFAGCGGSKDSGGNAEVKSTAGEYLQPANPEAPLEDKFGSAADNVLGVWKGQRADNGKECSLTFAEAFYYGGAKKTRELGVTLENKGSYYSVGGVDTEQYLKQKDQRFISFDFSASADNFGAITHRYSKMTVTMANGVPVEASGNLGDMAFLVIRQPLEKIVCKGLVKEI